eukprot:Clim_evm12s216 gene=Clim_evmTU12s216
MAEVNSHSETKSSGLGVLSAQAYAALGRTNQPLTRKAKKIDVDEIQSRYPGAESHRRNLERQRLPSDLRGDYRVIKVNRDKNAGLGISLVSGPFYAGRVYVSRVQRGSEAHMAGLRRGLRVLSVGDVHFEAKNIARMDPLKECGEKLRRIIMGEVEKYESVVPVTIAMDENPEAEIAFFEMCYLRVRMAERVSWCDTWFSEKLKSLTKQTVNKHSRGSAGSLSELGDLNGPPAYSLVDDPTDALIRGDHGIPPSGTPSGTEGVSFPRSSGSSVLQSTVVNPLRASQVGKDEHVVQKMRGAPGALIPSKKPQAVLDHVMAESNALLGRDASVENKQVQHNGGETRSSLRVSLTKPGPGDSRRTSLVHHRGHEQLFVVRALYNYDPEDAPSELIFRSSAFTAGAHGGKANGVVSNGGSGHGSTRSSEGQLSIPPGDGVSRMLPFSMGDILHVTDANPNAGFWMARNERTERSGLIPSLMLREDYERKRLRDIYLISRAMGQSPETVLAEAFLHGIYGLTSLHNTKTAEPQCNAIVPSDGTNNTTLMADDSADNLMSNDEDVARSGASEARMQSRASSKRSRSVDRQRTATINQNIGTGRRPEAVHISQARSVPRGPSLSKHLSRLFSTGSTSGSNKAKNKKRTSRHGTKVSPEELELFMRLHGWVPTYHPVVTGPVYDTTIGEDRATKRPPVFLMGPLAQYVASELVRYFPTHFSTVPWREALPEGYDRQVAEDVLYNPVPGACRPVARQGTRARLRNAFTSLHLSSLAERGSGTSLSGGGSSGLRLTPRKASAGNILDSPTLSMGGAAAMADRAMMSTVKGKNSKVNGINQDATYRDSFKMNPEVAMMSQEEMLSLKMQGLVFDYSVVALHSANQPRSSKSGDRKGARASGTGTSHGHDKRHKGSMKANQSETFILNAQMQQIQETGLDMMLRGHTVTDVLKLTNKGSRWVLCVGVTPVGLKNFLRSTFVRKGDIPHPIIYYPIPANTRVLREALHGAPNCGDLQLQAIITEARHEQQLVSNLVTSGPEIHHMPLCVRQAELLLDLEHDSAIGTVTEHSKDGAAVGLGVKVTGPRDSSATSHSLGSSGAAESPISGGPSADGQRPSFATFTVGGTTGIADAPSPAVESDEGGSARSGGLRSSQRSLGGLSSTRSTGKLRQSWVTIYDRAGQTVPRPSVE